MEPPGPGGQVIRLHELSTLLVAANVRIAYGWKDWIQPELTIPLRMIDQRPRFEDGVGAVVTDTESIHHRKETLVDVGDLELRAAIPVLTVPGGLSMTLRAGLTAPTGRVEADPFELGALGEEHQHVFFGSGSVDPLLGVDAAYPVGPVWLTADADARATLYSGRKGYRQGTRATAALGAYWLFDDWRVGLRPSLYFETASGWEGRAAPNSGRTTLQAAGSVGWSPVDGPALGISVAKPFTLQSHGGQVESPWLASASASWRFGGDEGP